MAPPSGPVHDPARLQELVAQCVDRMLDGLDDGLDALAVENPGLVETVRRRLDRLRRQGLLQTEVPRTGPTHFGEFELIEPIGEGGMGTVYRAMQTSLGREVALKVVRGDQLHMPSALSRFRREVEAVARLRAPGIVPIHAVGEQDGVPWYAMELLPGIDLGQVIGRLKGHDPGQLSAASVRDVLREKSGRSSSASDDAGLFDGSYLQFCSRVAVQAARTLAQVHDFGILHRDIKPSNLMLDAGGRLTLLDFGLARDEQADGLTRSGALLGSLPYMSPELVRDGAQKVDRRADVYSLGVTMYELLTLAPAFSGDAAGIRERILLGQLEPIRSRVPSVPRDLATICQKACERDPTRRYQSASEFADDLLRFLERRPIKARPVGPLLRAWRWAERRPARATALLALALFVTIGPTVYGWQQAQHATELRAALETSQRYQEAYRDSLLGALRVVEGATARLLTSPALLQDGRADPLRETALEELATYYEKLEQNDSKDPRIRAVLTKTRIQLAKVLMQLGRIEEALAVAELSVSMALTNHASLSADARNHDIVTGHLAIALRTRGMAHRRLGNSVEMVSDLERASELLALLGADSVDSEWSDEWIEARSSLAIARAQNHQLEESLEILEALIPLAEALVAKAPEDPDARRRLAAIQSNRANTTNLLGRPAEALEILGDLITLLDDDSTAVRFRDDELLAMLGRALANRASFERMRGRIRESLEDSERSTEIFEAMVNRFPLRQELRLRHASAQAALASTLDKCGDPDRAQELFETAIATMEELREDSPGAFDITQDLAGARMMYGDLLGGQLERIDDGIEQCELAIGLFEELLDAGRSNPVHVATARMNLAQTHWRNGDNASMAKIAERAIEDFERAEAQNPNDPQANRYRGEAHIMVASGLAQDGRMEEAKAHAARAMDECHVTAERIRVLEEDLGEDTIDALIEARR